MLVPAALVTSLRVYSLVVVLSQGQRLGLLSEHCASRIFFGNFHMGSRCPQNQCLNMYLSAQYISISKHLPTGYSYLVVNLCWEVFHSWFCFLFV